MIVSLRYVAIHSSGPILNKNMPRVAGMLKWSQELRDRVNSSLDKLKSLDKGY
jgi:dynein heavy chain